MSDPNPTPHEVNKSIACHNCADTINTLRGRVNRAIVELESAPVYGGECEYGYVLDALAILKGESDE